MDGPFTWKGKPLEEKQKSVVSLVSLFEKKAIQESPDQESVADMEQNIDKGPKDFAVEGEVMQRTEEWEVSEPIILAQHEFRTESAAPVHVTREFKEVRGEETVKSVISVQQLEAQIEVAQQIVPHDDEEEDLSEAAGIVDEPLKPVRDLIGVYEAVAERERLELQRSFSMSSEQAEAEHEAKTISDQEQFEKEVSEEKAPEEKLVQIEPDTKELPLKPSSFGAIIQLESPMGVPSPSSPLMEELQPDEEAAIFETVVTAKTDVTKPMNIDEFKPVEESEELQTIPKREERMSPKVTPAVQPANVEEVKSPVEESLRTLEADISNIKEIHPTEKVKEISTQDNLTRSAYIVKKDLSTEVKTVSEVGQIIEEYEVEEPPVVVKGTPADVPVLEGLDVSDGFAPKPDSYHVEKMLTEDADVIFSGPDTGVEMVGMIEKEISAAHAQKTETYISKVQKESRQLEPIVPEKRPAVDTLGQRIDAFITEEGGKRVTKEREEDDTELDYRGRVESSMLHLSANQELSSVDNIKTITITKEIHEKDIEEKIQAELKGKESPVQDMGKREGNISLTTSAVFGEIMVQSVEEKFETEVREKHEKVEQGERDAEKLIRADKREEELVFEKMHEGTVKKSEIIPSKHESTTAYVPLLETERKISSVTELHQEKVPSPEREKSPSPAKDEAVVAKEPSPVKEKSPSPAKEVEPSEEEEEEAAVPVVAKQPSPVKEKSPTPVREEVVEKVAQAVVEKVPSPEREKSPSPAKDEAVVAKEPSPVKEKSPSRAKEVEPSEEEEEEAAVPVVAKEPSPVKEKSPTPVREEVVEKVAQAVVEKVPSPEREKSPSPAKDQAVVAKEPSPVKEKSPSPAKDVEPSEEEQEEAAVPVVAKEPSPVKEKSPTPVREEVVEKVAQAVVEKVPSPEREKYCLVLGWGGRFLTLGAGHLLYNCLGNLLYYFLTEGCWGLFFDWAGLLGHYRHGSLLLFLLRGLNLLGRGGRLLFDWAGLFG